MKLLPNDSGENGVCIAVPKWGLGPRIIFWGLKTEKSRKLAIGAYSYELIIPKRKRISERLKRLWNHKTMAYRVYDRPWPLTPEVNTVHAFACTSAKIPGFWRFKIFCCNPRQTFTVNSPRGALQVWKILWTLTHKRWWTIRLKYWEYTIPPESTRLSVVRANVAWCRCRPMQWWAGQSFTHEFTAQCYAGARLLVRRLR